MSDTKKPAKVTLFPITGNIWRNESQKGVHYSISFERTYKDDAGNWQTTSSFRECDLPVIAKLTDWALDKIKEQQGFDQTAAAYVSDAS